MRNVSALCFVRAMRLEEVDREICAPTLDGVEWAATLCFAAYGARIAIRMTNSSVLDHLPTYLPPGCKPCRPYRLDAVYSLVLAPDEEKATRSAVTRYHRLYARSTVVSRTRDLSKLLAVLASQLHRAVATSARGMLFVHAGVVAWRGLAIAIPGRSRTGKTSLVEAFVRAGATYYSDEYAPLDAQGRVHPYPKPLSIRDDGTGLPQLKPVEAIGGRRGKRPLPVGVVVVTKYRSGTRWHPRQLSVGQTVLALLENTVLARRRSAFALQTLAQLGPGAVGLSGPRGEAPALIASLLAGLQADESATRHHQALLTRRTARGTQGTQQQLARCSCGG